MPDPNSEFWNILSQFLLGGLFGLSLVLLVMYHSWGRLKSVEWNRLGEGYYKILWIKRWIADSCGNNYLVLCETSKRDWENNAPDTFFRRPRLLLLYACPPDMEKVKAGERFYIKREKKKKLKVPAHNTLIRP